MDTVVSFRKVNKFYGKVHALKDLSFDVQEGEFLGLIGPNGAGKSTALRLLMEFIFPSSGELKVFGQPPGAGARARIGYVPAEVKYPSEMTGRQVLELKARVCGKNIDSESFLTYVKRFDFDMSRRISTYSLGNLKKLAVLQCLLGDPLLLVLDEPTSGLDVLMQHELLSSLQELNKDGMSVLFSSHQLSEVETVCHRIMMIKQGRLLRSESLDDIRANLYWQVRWQLAGDTKWREQSCQQMREVQLLVESMAGLPLIDLEIRKPSLEEIYFDLYENEPVSTKMGGGERR